MTEQALPKLCVTCREVIPATSRRSKFCSNVCLTKHYSPNKVAAPIPTPTAPQRPCGFCASPLPAGANEQRLYCNAVCAKKAARKPHAHSTTCMKCGKTFSTKTTPVRKYCTAACRKAALDDGDFKPGGRRKRAVETAQAEPAAEATSSSPSWPRHFVHRVEDVTRQIRLSATTASSKLRRGLVAGLRHIADRIA